MAKAILGIDIGYDNFKLVLTKGDSVEATYVGRVPEKIIKNGRVVSPEAMGELIRKTLKDEAIKAKYAAITLPDETVYVKNVTMPQMTADQLLYNLPYEFKDYITEELRDYVYDYAMISTKEEMLSAQNKSDAAKDSDKAAVADEDDFAGEDGASMDLIAVAARKDMIEEYTEIARKAGLKLIKAAPGICGYIPFIKKMDDDENKDYCMLDLGYNSIRMYMFKGDVYKTSRELEAGLSLLDSVISDAKGVDIHLAHTYLLNNHEDCQTLKACTEAYERIAVELMRALNFYQFSNPDSNLTDIWISGGGAANKPLMDMIRQTLSEITLHDAGELLTGSDDENGALVIQAAGVAIG